MVSDGPPSMVTQAYSTFTSNLSFQQLRSAAVAQTEKIEEEVVVDYEDSFVLLASLIN